MFLLYLIPIHMAKHSKWHQIKRKKAVDDVKKGKIFTKHAKLICLAAKNGSDPSMNPGLRMAVDNARADNMPLDNVERAIKKGSGELKENVQIDEVIYEAFAPGGVALYIQTFTDNRNRTVASLKTIIGRRGGTMAEKGSVGYLFEKKGYLVLDIPHKDQLDDLEMKIIDAGADDFEVVDDLIDVYVSPQNLFSVKQKLESEGVTVKSAELTYLPLTHTPIEDEKLQQELEDMLEAIEEDDDVVQVFTNA